MRKPVLLPAGILLISNLPVAAAGNADSQPENIVTTGSINEKPNIIFIMVDDMGWTDLECYGT